MQKATYVSQAVEIIERDGEVELDAYFITACLLDIKLKELGITYSRNSIDKWKHIFRLVD